MQKVLLALAAACFAAAPAALAQDRPSAVAEFVDADGQIVGSATLTGTPEGVLFLLEVTGLPGNRWLGLHVHETGTCNPVDGFDSAGGHFNPTDRAHGYLAEGGPHAGDMPNQHVDANGVLRSQVFNSFVTLDGGPTDVTGRALVIHAGEDDYHSQPTGEAGGRLACAVIR